MKKFLSLVVALMVTCTTFAGLSAGVTAQAAEKIKIGLSTDEGGLNDKSFNQAADTGIKKAKNEFHIDYKAIESKVKEDYEPNLQALVDDGAALTFGVGFNMQQAMTDVSKTNKDKKFAVIDTIIYNTTDQKLQDDKHLAANVESITFKENESSFLVGVIAGLTTKTNKIGFIGGYDQPLINKFEAGFAAGVKAVNPKAAANLMNRKNVIYVSSFADTNKGYEAATQLYGAGCDVVYHAAGGVGLGLFQKAQELKKSGKSVWAIGVDMDQAVTSSQYANVILTSAMKRVDSATYTAVKDLVKNQFKGGKHITLGLKENGVGIAPTKTNVSAKALAVESKYEALIKSGKLNVPEVPKDVKAFKAPVVK